MSNRVSRRHFEGVVRAARALRGEPQSGFGQIDALQTDCSEHVANSHDRRHHDEANCEQDLGNDEFADEIDLEYEQNRKRLQNGLANLWFLCRFQKKALSLFQHFVHDPEPLNPLTCTSVQFDAREHPKVAIQ